MSESLYDKEIAPKLKELSELCLQHKMPFVALVEYEPGQCGRTEAVGFDACFPMHVAAMAARCDGNVDALCIGIIKTCERKGIDAKSSIFLKPMLAIDKRNQGT